MPLTPQEAPFAINYAPIFSTQTIADVIAGSQGAYQQAMLAPQTDPQYILNLNLGIPVYDNRA